MLMETMVLRSGAERRRRRSFEQVAKKFSRVNDSALGSTVNECARGFLFICVVKGLWTPHRSNSLHFSIDFLVVWMSLSECAHLLCFAQKAFHCDIRVRLLFLGGDLLYTCLVSRLEA